MTVLTRIAEKCRKCPQVKECNNKLLEACALSELPKQPVMKVTTANMLPTNRTTTSIMIDLNKHGDIDAIKKEVFKKVTNAFRIGRHCF